mmetsp:Transcript_3291/g.7292  ORF Transcript_3291/g.7292 Transcript_3291/m.7292 type:complete len:265 (-) Transcript_3291:631-1425(-)
MAFFATSIRAWKCRTSSIRIFPFLPEPLPRKIRSNPSSSARRRANGDAAGLFGLTATFFFGAVRFFFWTTFTFASSLLVENSTIITFSGFVAGSTAAITFSDAAAFIKVTIGMSSAGGLGVAAGAEFSVRTSAAVANRASASRTTSSFSFWVTASSSLATITAIARAGSSRCASLLYGAVALTNKPTSCANTSISNTPSSNIFLNSFLYILTPACRCEYARNNVNVTYIIMLDVDMGKSSSLRSTLAKKFLKKALSSTPIPPRL